MTSFNLVDEPWLPCIRPDGTPVEMGLYDTLVQAHRLRELHGDTPLATAALHRLLLAILHRVFGPQSRKEWSHLWRRGRWDEVALRAYFDEWHDRFDLFDDEHPFYQSADPRVKPKSVTSMAHHLASGNNPTLFDHHTDSDEVCLTPAQAARLIIAIQCFGLAGLTGLSQKFTDGTCARGIVFIVRGKTLFETLSMNLVRYTEDRPLPGGPKDRPVWEMEDPFTPDRSVPFGYLDYLTWQNRRILLLPEDQEGKTVVSKMTMAPALRLDGSVLDPMTHYRRDEQRGALPLSFREGRALWRDSAALFQLRDASQQVPAVFLGLAELVADGYLPGVLSQEYMALGMSKKQAKVFFARHEEMPLPLAFLEDESLAESLRDALKVAEDVGQALHSACSALAQWIVSPADRAQAQRDDTKLVAARLDAENRYWSRLEVPFHGFIRDLLDDRQRALAQWVDRLQRTARDAFNEAAEGITDPTRGLKAVTLARGTLERKMAQAISRK